MSEYYDRERIADDMTINAHRPSMVINDHTYFIQIYSILDRLPSFSRVLKRRSNEEYKKKKIKIIACLEIEPVAPLSQEQSWKEQPMEFWKKLWNLALIIT